MAIPGFSGSNGGISRTYRKLKKGDIQKLIDQYESKIQYKVLFKESISNLKKLFNSLEDKL
ncbi:MAG: hypothetical protein IB618_02030 [Candidatus Pacearchaeota archaeon]|nr:MAG: hypothetical protein IB618_02030 [Candidatus Pacearchaeota archaeon]